MTKLFLFDNNENLIGAVDPLEGKETNELNKIHSLEVIVNYSELIDKAVFIGHKDYKQKDVFHLYKIDHLDKESATHVKIVAVHTFYDDMESDGYIKDFRPKNKELVGVLTNLLNGTRWQLGTVNVQRIYSGNFYYLSRKEALSKLIEETQIEIAPRLEFTKSKITARYLDVFTRMGRDNGKVFIHGKDLLTVHEKNSKGAIYTAVIGRGKGEEITDEDGQATGGYGRRITYKDVVWEKDAGKPVDKPAGEEMLEIPAFTKIYGFEKGTKPRVKIVEFQDEEDPERLIVLAYEWLKQNSRVQVEYKATVRNVGDLDLGDTVGVFNPKLGIKYKTRVFKIVRDLTDNKLTEFGIGDKVTTSPFSRTIELAKEMKNFQDDTVYWLDKIRERLSDKFLNEDGYNYDLKANNNYELPAGYYSFDKPIDQNPTKVVYMGAGKIAIANSKKPTGEWNWKTFLDGTGATLDLINTGVLRAGRIQSADGRSYWDLDTGEFHMEQSAINEAVNTAINGKVQEIVGEVKKSLPTKEELKGADSYIHKKYSDFPDGRNMSDNSTLRYIGIYTGTSRTAPTDCTQYSWTKIKGEDGRKGEDGKVPNFNLLINSEINDEDSFKTNGETFKLNKGDYNGKNSIEIINNNFTSPAFQGVYFRSAKTSFKKGDKAVLRLPMYIYSDIPVDNGMFIIVKDEKTGTVPYVRSITNRDPRDKWFVIEEKLEALKDFTSTDDYIFKVYTNNNGHFKIAEPYFALGEEVPKEWMPSLEDLKAHSLTANVRINGTYEGAKTNGVKFFVDVFFDGKKVTDGFKLTAKVQGAGLNKTQENATYNNTGELTNVYYLDGEKDGTAITIQLDVEYKHIRTTCFSKLDNLPSPVLVKEIISKYKTFDSTIDQFESKIGEINNKKFKLAYNIENICFESGVEKIGNDLYFNTKTPLKKDKEYFILADLEDVPEEQNTRIYKAKGNGDIKTITNGSNVWRISYESEQTRVNIYPLGSNTKVKNVEIFEVPDYEFPKVDLIKTTNSDFHKKGNITIETKEPVVKDKIYSLEFEIAENIDGRMVLSYVNGDSNIIVRKKIVEGLNKISLRGNGVSDTFTVGIPPNLTVSNIKFYKENFDIGYKNEYNISEIESSIKQTKNEIDLKVSKNNVIASINASVETTGNGSNQGIVKINADKVDISGVLRAYTGEIGGFRIGHNYNDNGFWLTGRDNFNCGINPGGNVGTRGAQIWAAWGYNWLQAGENAWWVDGQGVMHCYNRPILSKGLDISGGNLDMHGSDIEGYADMHKNKTTVIWWNQIDRVKSRISDQRLKTNVKPTKVKALDTLNSIEMVEFNWKKDNKFEKIGAIAQQVQSVDESLVVHDMDDKQTYNDYLRIKYYDTIPYLIKAVQELSEENDNLKLRLQKLEDKINGNL